MALLINVAQYYASCIVCSYSAGTMQILLLSGWVLFNFLPNFMGHYIYQDEHMDYNFNK